MFEKTKKSEPFEIDIEFQPAPQGSGLRDPSPGFQVVAIGLVAHIFYTARIVTFTWLQPVSILNSLICCLIFTSFVKIALKITLLPLIEQEKYGRLCVTPARAAMSQLQLSARAYHRILKLARTIVDLADSDSIQQTHLAETLQYRPKLNMMG